ncbi:MAG: helix-turn-helix domain-containing protein [Phycisphaerales bacterium]
MKNPPDMLRLSDAAEAAGVTPAQLQYYLMVGVVTPTQISPGHQRLFDPHAVQRIAMIRLLNESGYSLRDIREIFIQKGTKG